MSEDALGIEISKDDGAKELVVASYKESRAKYMHYKAQRKKNEYLLMIGELIPMDFAMNYCTKVGTKLSMAFRSLADRLAPRLAYETDEATIEKLIKEEVDIVIKLVESAFLSGQLQRELQAANK